MMTQQVGFSILSAPLAAIDRRALSQAWYSALHLAKTPHLGAQTAAPPAARCAPHVAVPGRATPVRPDRASAIRVVPHGAPHVRLHETDGGVERRAPRSSLARKMEHCFLDPVRRVRRASFTLEGSDARVHVALQGGDGSLRLIAVCPSRVREAVARALEETRYALAARGIALHVDLRSVRP
ncbi:MAG TPA: hypothetical protein VIK27_08400 [Candidatus Aquilonibacter sp.]